MAPRFHATQNWEEGFETLFPALVGTQWETPSTLALVVIGLGAGIVVWRRGGRAERPGDDPGDPPGGEAHRRSPGAAPAL